jgi:glutaredoxin
LKQVVLYSRADCGLCAKAESLLRRLLREIRFSLEVVDIDSDKQAHDRYWLQIPVVLVDGEEMASAPIDERKLRSALRS